MQMKSCSALFWFQANLCHCTNVPGFKSSETSSYFLHLLTILVMPGLWVRKWSWHMLKDVQSFLAARDMGSRNAVILYPSEQHTPMKPCLHMQVNFFWILIFRGAPKYKFTNSCIPLQQWLLALWKGTYMPIHPHPPTVPFTLSFC